MQNQNTPAADQEHQAKISRILIGSIIAMVFIYANCTANSENDQVFITAMICPSLLLLTTIYTFTYRGKAYRTSRVLFFILLVLSTLSIWAFLYLVGLAKAFQH